MQRVAFSDKRKVDAPTQDFSAVVGRTLGLVVEAHTLLRQAGVTGLTDGERAHSNGKLRAGELEALRATCDAMDASPGAFESLAAHDRGIDPAVVETGPTRAALERYETVAPLVQAVSELLRDVADEALTAVSLAKQVTKPAYAILKANAKINSALRAVGKKALDYYARDRPLRARRGARAKAATDSGKMELSWTDGKENTASVPSETSVHAFRRVMRAQSTEG